MTIDERLEAIARNLELVASLQAEHDRRIAMLFERQSELTAAMTKLANYVFDHEDRIGQLEGR